MIHTIDGCTVETSDFIHARCSDHTVYFNKIYRITAVDADSKRLEREGELIWVSNHIKLYKVLEQPKPAFFVLIIINEPTTMRAAISSITMSEKETALYLKDVIKASYTVNDFTVGQSRAHAINNKRYLIRVS